MLLLGAKAAMNADPSAFNDPRKKVPGDEVSIELSWNEGKRNVQKRADELVQDYRSGKVISKGPWIYNGSHIIDGGFVAQREGSIVTLISDAFALINNPRVGRENDEIWFASTNRVPPLNTPVEVTIKLEKIWKAP
jgi:hypothetical protein